MQKAEYTAILFFYSCAFLLMLFPLEALNRRRGSQTLLLAKEFISHANFCLLPPSPTADMANYATAGTQDFPISLDDSDDEGQYYNDDDDGPIDSPYQLSENWDYDRDDMQDSFQQPPQSTLLSTPSWQHSFDGMWTDCAYFNASSNNRSVS